MHNCLITFKLSCYRESIGIAYIIYKKLLSNKFSKILNRFEVHCFDTLSSSKYLKLAIPWVKLALEHSPFMWFQCAIYARHRKVKVFGESSNILGVQISHFLVIHVFFLYSLCSEQSFSWNTRIMLLYCLVNGPNPSMCNSLSHSASHLLILSLSPLHSPSASLLPSFPLLLPPSLSFVSLSPPLSYSLFFSSLLSLHKSHHPLDHLPSGPCSQSGSIHRIHTAYLKEYLWIDRPGNPMNFSAIQEPAPLGIAAHPFLVRMIPKYNFPLESYSN